MAINTITRTNHPDLGLTEASLNGVVKLLSIALADQHVLYMKTRNFHWNVTGAQFAELHELFERQYDDLKLIIDETAEKIRQYGAYAPGTMTEMLQMTTLREHDGDVPDAQQMVHILASDHEQAVRSLREFARQAGNEYDDIAAEDYFTGLIHGHQKTAWLLRSHLEGGST